MPSPSPAYKRTAGALAADAPVAAEVLAPGRPLEFVHPIVRTAVGEGNPPAERAVLHLQAARLLYAEGGDAERVAPHLLATERRGDAWVVDVLRAAAARSVDRGAPEAAVRYLGRALAEPPDHQTRAAILAELGKAEVRAGLPDEAVEHLLAALAATPDPRQRPQMTQDLAIGLIAPGRYEEAVAILADAVEDAAQVDPELARRIEAELLAGTRLDPRTLPVARARFARLSSDMAGDSPGDGCCSPRSRTSGPWMGPRARSPPVWRPSRSTAVSWPSNRATPDSSWTPDLR